VCRCFLGSCLSCSSTSWIHARCCPRTGFSRLALRRYPGGSTWDSIFTSVRQLMPCSRQAAHFDNSPVRTRRRTSVHISIAASTPRASLSERGNRGSAAIVLTDNTAQLYAALFDRCSQLEFIKTGELDAFNVASKHARRPQFKIPSAALQAFQERRSGRDPVRSIPRPVSRRSSRKPSSSSTRTYF